MDIGHVVHFFDELPSTNDYLAQVTAKADPTHGMVVFTDYQSSGQGQFGRKWDSDPAKNIMMSVYLKTDDLPLKKIALLHFVVSLAVVEAISMFLTEDHKVQIKWPNDILINNKKVAGVLIKNTISASVVKSSIVGLGLNVFQTTFDKAYASRVTSLLIENANISERSLLLNQLFKSLNIWYSQREQSQKLKNKYMDYLLGVNEVCQYRDLSNNEVFDGELIQVEFDGRVQILIHPQKNIKLFNPGEIMLLY